jgi:hypothetical protein
MEFVYRGESGSSQPVRFLKLDEDSKATECIDCDAKSHVFALEEMHFDCPKLEKLKDALLFVLWNTDWPVGD